MSYTNYRMAVISLLFKAVLLLRSFASTRNALLFWAALCFLGLTLNNALLFVDKVIATDVDLSLWRTIPALVGMLVLIFGLVWEEARP